MIGLLAKTTNLLPKTQRLFFWRECTGGLLISTLSAICRKQAGNWMMLRWSYVHLDLRIWRHWKKGSPCISIATGRLWKIQACCSMGRGPRDKKHRNSWGTCFLCWNLYQQCLFLCFPAPAPSDRFWGNKLPPVMQGNQRGCLNKQMSPWDHTGYIR